MPTVTGPVGEPGLPPSRPASTKAAPSSQRPAAPRAQAPLASRRGYASFVKNGGGSRSGTPETDRSESLTSRTFVPTLTAQGFSRPMSSQKLQAQRGYRPSSAMAQTTIPDERDRPSVESVVPDRDAQHRYSNASLNTLRDGPQPPRVEDAPPLPVSRDTFFSTEARTQQGSQAPGSVTSTSSAMPLQAKQGQPLNRTGSLPRSPISLRASLGLGSRTASKQDQRPSGHHERLHSSPSSPNINEKELPPLPPPSRGQEPAVISAGKNYEYFAGKTIFFLAGRCLNTRAKPLNVVTFVLTALPVVLFFGFSAPWLWHNVSPAIPIIFAYIFYVTISSFVHAAVSDPGILPRNLHPQPADPPEADPLAVGPPTTEWVMVKTFPSQRASQSRDDEAQRPVAATAMEVPVKYCKTCNIWRPPRAHHCRVCDACMETQDHHCVWLNNCVGRRNYRYFFTYVGFSSLLAIFLIAFTLTHISSYASQHHISFGKALSGRSQERVAFAMFMYSLLALPYPGSLFCYHVFLTSRGETTREYLNSHKFLPKDRHRPFSQSSWFRNLRAVLSRPRPPTYLQFHHQYAPGDTRLGHTARKKDRKADLANRYSVSTAGVGKEGEKGALEMMQLPFAPGKKRMIAKQSAEGLRNALHVGGMSGPNNRTPR